jgi:hypothetical protein
MTKSPIASLSLGLYETTVAKRQIVMHVTLFWAVALDQAYVRLPLVTPGTFSALRQFLHRGYLQRDFRFTKHLGE